jgi:RNA polymerase sigma-70 factor (ECF subfamily)
MFVRRRGHDAHEAEDLTQEFFARLLERKFLRSVDPAKGKFRSFLLASLEHFLANEWRRSQAQKRGGGAAHFSLDDTAAEQRYQQVAHANALPGALFDRQWAMALLERTVSNLRDEFRAAGKGDLFNQIKTFLTGNKPASSYDTLAGTLHTTEAALKMAVSRMRRRYGELLRAEIGRTVASPDDIDEELRALFAALA